MCAAIKMRLKSHTIVTDVPQRAEAEHLKPSAVGQYRPIPCHKTMETAQLSDGLMSGPQKEVVRIAQKNLDV